MNARLSYSCPTTVRGFTAFELLVVLFVGQVMFTAIVLHDTALEGEAISAATLRSADQDDVVAVLQAGTSSDILELFSTPGDGTSLPMQSHVVPLNSQQVHSLNFGTQQAFVVVSGAGATPGAVKVLRRNATGFTSLAPVSTGFILPSDGAVGDLNGDGKDDLVVTSLQTAHPNTPGFRYSVHYANASGTNLLPGVVTVLPSNQSSSESLDWKSASLIDSRPGSAPRAGKRDSGSRSPDQIQNSSVTPLKPLENRASFITSGLTAVTIIDVNADSRADLVVAGGDPLLGGCYVQVILNSPSGPSAATARPRIPLTVSGVNHCAVDLVATDMNSDGIADLALSSTTTSQTGEGSVLTLVGRSGGDFAPPEIHETAFLPGNLSIFEINNDGRPDLVVAIPGALSPSGGGLLTILVNDSAKAITFDRADVAPGDGALPIQSISVSFIDDVMYPQLAVLTTSSLKFVTLLFGV